MITVMDGGMGRELIRRGVALRSGLWSATALISAPKTVVEVHRDFIAAGARIITTNSYSCVPSYLGKAGQSHRYAELAGLSGQLAREAADGSEESVLVAGSMPPLSESYRPDLVIDDAEAGPIYATLAAALEPHIDMFLCETMSSIRETRNAAEAALASAAARGLPVYVAWTLDEHPGSGLRSGESIREAHAALADLPIAGFLFNCTHPDAIEAGLGEIGGLTDLPTGGYPNRFDVPKGFTLDGSLSVKEREDFGTEQFVRAAQQFIDRGASFVGGCCGISPEDIAALTAHLSQAEAPAN